MLVFVCVCCFVMCLRVLLETYRVILHGVFMCGVLFFVCALHVGVFVCCVCFIA